MKTAKEWSNTFDVLYNQVMNNAAAALDEYDKSVFLTKAQDEIVKNYFNPKGNKYQEGYDDSAKRQADFATLMKTVTLESLNSGDYDCFDYRSTAYKFPTDYFIAVNEQLQVFDNTMVFYPYTIVPLSYKEYARVMQKPYKYPPKNQAWRLITGEVAVEGTGYWVRSLSLPKIGSYTVADLPTPSPAEGKESYESIAEAEDAGWKYFKVSDDGAVPVIELIGKYATWVTKKYKLRYVRRPKPIILIDLDTVDNQLSINGVNKESPCELPEHIHEEIMQRAVELAKAAYATDQNGTAQLTNQVQIGQRSE